MDPYRYNFVNKGYNISENASWLTKKPLFKTI